MKNGGAAFPGVISEKDGNGNYDTFSCGGMTLRDYFAGQALTSCNLQEIYGSSWEVYLNVATTAYNLADAMIAERERKNEVGGSE